MWKSAPGVGNYRYLYGPGGTLVGMVKGSTLYFVHTNHLGRPEIVTNAAKAVVWRASNFALNRKVTADNDVAERIAQCQR